MREALELGYTNNTIFTHRKFRLGAADTDAVYLNDKEVEELYKLDLSSQKKLERVRDLFVIGCFTGLRFSDLGQLLLISLGDEIIELRQIKTGDPVYIALQPEVKTIMASYNNGFPATLYN